MLYRSKSFRLCHRSIMAAHLKTQSLDETTNSDSYCMKRNESSLLNTLQSTETPLFKQPKKQRCIHKPDHPQTKTEICSRVNFGDGSPFGIVSLHKLKIAVGTLTSKFRDISPETINSTCKYVCLCRPERSNRQQLFVPLPMSANALAASKCIQPTCPVCLKSRTFAS